MKIYIYKWKHLRWFDSTSTLLTINVLFNVWRVPYTYLNRLFLTQSSHPNWFVRLFNGKIEIVFLPMNYDKGIIDACNWYKWMRVI